MRRFLLILATVAVAGAGLVGAVSGVLAFEAQVVKVNAEVSNALEVTKTFQWGATDTLFPQEFVLADMHLMLSQAFVDQSRVDTVAVEVWAQCSPGSQWLGDFAYLSGSSPFVSTGVGPVLQLPGGNLINLTTGEPTVESGAAGPTPPVPGDTDQDKDLKTNDPWTYVGGDYSFCPGNVVPVNVVGGASPSNVITLDTLGGSSVVDFTLGLDVPVCDFTYNAPTDVPIKPSGYSVPTVILQPHAGDAGDPVDPRYGGPETNPGCSFAAVMQVVFQVVGIETAALPGPEVVASPSILTTSSTINDTFVVSLTSVPLSNVTVTMTSNNTTEGLLNEQAHTHNPHDQLSFNFENLNFNPSIGGGLDPKGVVLVGQSGASGGPYTITLEAFSSDPAYAGLITTLTVNAP